MILDKQALIEKAKSLIGERTDDDFISFLEDLTDTIDSVKITDDVQSLKDRIAELEEKNATIDNDWRNKYIARFSGETEKDVIPEPPETQEQKEHVDIEQIFSKE